MLPLAPSSLPLRRSPPTSHRHGATPRLPAAGCRSLPPAARQRRRRSPPPPPPATALTTHLPLPVACSMRLQCCRWPLPRRLAASPPVAPHQPPLRCHPSAAGCRSLPPAVLSPRRRSSPLQLGRPAVASPAPLRPCPLRPSPAHTNARFCSQLRKHCHSNQLYGDRVLLRREHAVQFHSYAKKVASPNLPSPREMPKNIFLHVKNNFEKALGMLKAQVKLDDPAAAVSQYAKVVSTETRNQIATFSDTSVCDNNFKVRHRELQCKMQECARLGDLSGALDILDLMRPLTLLDYNALLYSYIKSEHASVEHLGVLYDMLGTSGLHPTVWTFNIILNGLCSLGHVESAFWFVEEMCHHGYIPSFPSLSRLMKKSLRLDALDVSLSLLDLMLRYDYFPTLSVLCYLISSLSRVRRVAEAYSIFSLLLDRGICPSVYSYNPILFALSRSGEIRTALSIFCFAGKKGCVHNVYSYTALILGFCEKRIWGNACWILEQMQGDGCEPSVVTYTILIKSLCDDGKVREALDILDMMTKQGCNADLVIYNIIIRALCCHRMISEVCKLMLVATQKGLYPDAFSVSALAGGLFKAGNVSHALAFLHSTSRIGFAGDVVTWNIYFHCLCRDNKSKEALFLLRNRMGEGFVPSVVTYNTILKGYCREQNIDEALLLFDHFEWPKGGPDLISFNTVLSAACKQRCSLIIQRILYHIDLAGVKLDGISIACLFWYFCKVPKLSDCLGVLNYISSSESVNRSSYNILLGSLCKEGNEPDKIS